MPKAVRFEQYGGIDVLQVAELIAAGELEIPVAAVFPLADVQDAYRRLEQGHIRGKIVLVP